MADIRLPADRHRLDLLLVPCTDQRTGKLKSGFETVAECEEEDRSRAVSIRANAPTATVAAIPNGNRATSANSQLARLNLDPLAALNLADRLEAGAESGRPEPTLASRLFMREQRLRWIGGLLELCNRNAGVDTRIVTAIHPSWSYPADWLLDADARLIKNQFRTHLNRGAVTSAAGFLFTHLHGEFEPISQEYQLHFHGLCGGEKLKAFDRLRNKQGYIRTPKIYRPIVINEIKDPARQISYVMQSFWPRKARTPSGRRQREGQRIEEPYQSLYLMWLDKWRFGDLCELNGLRIQGEKLVLS